MLLVILLSLSIFYTSALRLPTVKNHISRSIRHDGPVHSRMTLAMSQGDSKGRLTQLCEISRDACTAVSPMLAAFYKKIRFAAGDSSTAKLKSDSTFFSIADGIVQHMFIQYLFAGNKFYNIVGKNGRILNVYRYLTYVVFSL